MNGEECELEIRNWVEQGCKLIANVVTASGKAQPPSYDEENAPKGYVSVAQELQKRAIKLTRRLWKGPMDTLARLDSANDTLLERLEITLSRLEGKPAATIQRPMPLPVPENQFRPASSRPQLLFKDKVDNSDSPWIPRLLVKHNAISPFRLKPVSDDKGVVTHYEHPYTIELENYTPSSTFINLESLPEIFLKKSSETPFKYIDQLPDLEALIEHLDTVSEMAVDLEHHSYRSFQGFACLIQISTEAGGDFIVDALSLREHLHRLNTSFTNPKILKVFHGADHDVLWLQRDFGVYLVGLFDTYRAAVELGLYNKSLQSLLWNYCKITTNKSLRLADWRARPLKEELIDYARMDTHGLLYIWRRMREDLLKSGNGGAERLLNVFHESKKVCLSIYSKPKFNEEYVTEFQRKSKKNFDSRQVSALRRVLCWRDEIAREEDESTSYVLPNHMVLQLVSEMPKESAGIIACCYPTPPLVLHHLNIVLQLLDLSRNEPVTKKPAELIKEEIINTPKSIHIYNNQSLKNYVTEPNILNTIKQLKEMKIRTKKKSILSKETDDGSINVMKKNDHFHFVPPFHRRILVKKYVEAIHEQTNTAPKEPETAEVVEKQIINIPEVISISKPEKRKLDDAPVVEESTKTPEIPAKKSKNEIKEDTPVQPFDYKSYDYNSFNKNSPHHHHYHHQYKKKFNNPKHRHRK